MDVPSDGSTRKRRSESFETRVPPIRSEHDKKSYRIIELPNGLRATLVSTTENAEDVKKTRFSASPTKDARSASQAPQSPSQPAVMCLAVSCGSFSDDPNTEGMAHFIEHMVFWGSEKYPQENGMIRFLHKHGATKGAMTLGDSTIYEIGIVESALPEALDRFAHLFIKPTFSKAAITREIHAIDHEFYFREGTNYRLNEFVSMLADKNHPMNRFRCGTSETLVKRADSKEVDIRDQMVAFFDRYYTADAMTLCVVSERSLDTLEHLVKLSFSAIAKPIEKSLSPVANSAFVHESPFNAAYAKLYKMISYDRDSVVVFQWVLPSQKKLFREKAIEYMAYVLSHKCTGSLSDYLVFRGWALRLSAGCRDEVGDNPFCTLFEIQVMLTSEGVRSISCVATVVHQFLHHLRRIGPQEWLWEELKQGNEARFRYMLPTEPVALARSIATGMQLYPDAHLLTGSTLFMSYDGTHIQSLMDLLVPTKCCTIVISSTFLKEAETFDLREPRMDTWYKVEDYPTDWTVHWQENTEFQKLFAVPEKNPFMTMDYPIVQEDLKTMRVPELLAQSQRSRLWYYRDVKCRLPFAHVCLHFISQVRLTSQHIICNHLIPLIFAELLKWADSYVKVPTLNLTPVGLEIMFTGYQPKLALLVQVAMGALLKFECTEEIFQRVKYRVLHQWQNDIRDNDIFAGDTLRTLLDPDFMRISDRYEKLKSLTRADVMERVQELCKGHLETYIHGNISSKDARALVSNIETKVNTFVLRGRGSHDQPRVNDGKTGRPRKMKEAFHVRMLSFNPGARCSRIINYYRYGPAGGREEILISLLEILIRVHCYILLRRTWQLGYDPECTIDPVDGVYALNVSVSPMASTLSLSHVDEKIDEFVDNVAKEMSNLDKDEFAKAKEILIRTVVNNSLPTVSLSPGERFWRQIRAQQCNFDANAMPSDFTEIVGLRLEGFKQWAVEALTKMKNRKLSVQVVGFGQAALEECEGGDELWQKFQSNPRHCVPDDGPMPTRKMLIPKNVDALGKTYLQDFNLLVFMVRATRTSFLGNES